MFNFNLFFKNCIFIIFVYLFGFFHGDFVVCDDLIKIVYKNITVRYTPTLSSTRLYDSIEFFQNYILNTPGYKFKFNMYRYTQFNGLRFSYNSVYDHYHINLFLNNSYNVHYGSPLIHNPQKLGLLPHEYTTLADYDFKNRNVQQYILNSLYIYDMNLIKFQDYTDAYNNYIKTNESLCVTQFQKIIKK